MKAKNLGITAAVLGIAASALTIWAVLLRDGPGRVGRSQDDEPVGPVQILKFSARPASVRPGQTATLKWSVRNGERTTIQPGVGSVALTGEHPVQPDRTTVYSLTASGGGRTSTANATVTVIPESLVERYSKGTMPGDAIHHVRVLDFEDQQITFEVDYRINPAHKQCYVAGVLVHDSKVVGSGYTISALQGTAGTGRVGLTVSGPTVITSAILYLFESGKSDVPFIAKEIPCRWSFR